MNKSLSNPDVIRIAACPVCCAYRREPCTFTRAEDRYNRRAAAGKSHDERVLLAKRKAQESQTDIEKLAASIVI